MPRVPWMKGSHWSKIPVGFQVPSTNSSVNRYGIPEQKKMPKQILDGSGFNIFFAFSSHKLAKTLTLMSMILQRISLVNSFELWVNWMFQMIGSMLENLSFLYWVYIYIHVYIPRTQMTLVLIGKGLVLGGWSSKIEVSWVLGIYISYQKIWPIFPVGTITNRGLQERDFCSNSHHRWSKKVETSRAGPEIMCK